MRLLFSLFLGQHFDLYGLCFFGVRLLLTGPDERCRRRPWTGSAPATKRRRCPIPRSDRARAFLFPLFLFCLRSLPHLVGGGRSRHFTKNPLDLKMLFSMAHPIENNSQDPAPILPLNLPLCCYVSSPNHRFFCAICRNISYSIYLLGAFFTTFEITGHCWYRAGGGTKVSTPWSI